MRTSWSTIAPLLVLGLFATSSAHSAVEPRLISLEPCTFAAGSGKVEAECGWIAVPETHFAATDAEIHLPFVRFKSTAATPGTPIVYLAGGPGGSGIGTARTARFALFMKLREAADVITIDQRGTGNAKPNLSYSETWGFPLNQPADYDVWKPIAERKLVECAEHFRKQGVTLGHYNTRESAADIDALRRVLGLKKISLWGTSYGTHLSCAIVRYHGAHLNRVVLAGAEGPDHTFKLPSTADEYLQKLSAELAARPEVAAKIPDFLTLTKRLLDKLAAEPVRIDWQGKTLVLGPLDLQIYIAEAIGRRRTIRPLPATLYLADQGDFRRIAGMASQYRTGSVGNAMSLAMDCASGGSAERRARLQREGAQTVLGNAQNFPFDVACSALGVPDVGDEFRGPLTSDVPILFISGTLDARTPIANAEELRRGFATSYHLIVQNAGHDEELFSQAPGLGDRMVSFFQGQTPSEEQILYAPIEIAPIE